MNGTETVSDLPFPSVSKDGDGNEVQNQTTALNCYHTTLSRSTTVTGAAQTLYYTVDPVYAAINEEGTDTLIGTSYDDSKWQLPHVLVRIVHPLTDTLTQQLTKRTATCRAFYECSRMLRTRNVGECPPLNFISQHSLSEM